jgi:hypothetical protein
LTKEQKNKIKEMKKQGKKEGIDYRIVYFGINAEIKKIK